MMIYADNAATTKMSRAAIDAMIPCLEEQYGNPSSLYTLGQKAKEILDDLAGYLPKFRAVISDEYRSWLHAPVGA